MERSTLSIAAAELVGTFCLVFVGCGAIAADGPSGLGSIGIALSFGLIVMAMIYSVGNVSGAHINPAVTVGFYLAGRLRGRRVAPYVVSQLLGAVLAAGLLRLLFENPAGLGITSPAGGVMRALVMEVALTSILMFVILNVSTGHMEKGIMAGVAVGGTVCVAALVGGGVSGASMNPARSIGPALVSIDLRHIWLYIAGPIAGAALASPGCRLIQGRDCCSGKDTDG